MSAHKDSLRAQHPDLTHPGQGGRQRRGTAQRALADLWTTFALDQTIGNPTVYRYYPRVIRAFDDVWSKKGTQALYQSPIARLIWTYINHVESQKTEAFKYRVVDDDAFVSIAADGSLRIERGYVRPEDELPVEPELADDGDADGVPGAGDTRAEGDAPDGPGAIPATEPEEDEGLRPIPDKLLTELTAHRTLALRHALGERPDVAFLAALHALALGVFYTYRSDTCLELDLKSVQFGSQAPGLNDTPLARAFDERHQSPRCIVWDLAEVQAWLLARRAKPIHRAQHPDVTKRKSRPVKGRDRAQQEA
jgi:hypothetical protein